MNDSEQRHEATTTSDLSRQAATTDDSDYSLSIEDALARYEAAGLPRTTRSIQRYCAKGHLDAHRIETPFGEKFLITPASVERHIAYINEVRPVATSRDLSRLAATDVAGENNNGEPLREAATSSDESRQSATTAELSRLVAAEDRYVARLESENEFLRAQVGVKDKQIAEMLERGHETNSDCNGCWRRSLVRRIERAARQNGCRGSSSAYPHPRRTAA
jgi:hypothetical protein